MVAETQMIESVTLRTFENEIAPHPVNKKGMSIDLDLLLNSEIVLGVINDTNEMQPTTHILESEDIWIADTGATSHINKYKTGGTNHQ